MVTNSKIYKVGVLGFFMGWIDNLVTGLSGRSKIIIFAEGREKPIITDKVPEYAPSLLHLGKPWFVEGYGYYAKVHVQRVS